MFFGFIENDLTSQNQSGFKSEDFWINQVLSITHEIFKSLDDGWKVRGVYVDITKIFDKKVWYQVSLKLKKSVIS